MMQTGPVVTLQVAKFAASFHGLGAVLSDPTPETTTGENTIGLTVAVVVVVIVLNFRPPWLNQDSLSLPKGGRGPTEPGGKGLTLNSVDPAPSDRLNGGNRGTTDRIIQRNRQLYRSDPDMKGARTSIIITRQCGINTVMWDTQRPWGTTPVCFLFSLVSVCFSPEEGDPVDPVVRGNNMAAVSTLHLCYDVRLLDYCRFLCLIQWDVYKMFSRL